MTRHGKCYVCRLRKVKCDEKRPSCDACRKKGRPCSYSSNAENWQVPHKLPSTQLVVCQRSAAEPLYTETSRRASSGWGSYHVLAFKKTQHIPALSSMPRPSDDSRLALRWSSMLGSGPAESCSFVFMGPLFRSLPARIGSHPMLNLAVTYALDCHSAFKKAGKADRKVALRSGAQVMRALRNALTTKAEESASTILMTMRLLFAAEIFGEIGSLHYALHLSAVSELLRLRWTSGQFEELDEALVNESYFEEVVESVHNGRISAFDDPLRPRPATLGDATTFEFESASNFVRERLIRIPRLVYLVRRCSQNPDDDALVLETLALTTEIYDVKFALLVEEFITESTTIADTSSDMESAPPLQSFLFNSIQEFNLTVYYYTFRILICGIIQYMLDVQIAPQVYFDRSKVGAEDIKAAERIAMCLDYAFNPKFDPPFGALRMYKPCTLAYGSWDRLEKRERTIHGSEAPDCARALLMKQYCFEAVDRIALIWNGGGVAEELLVLTCGAFAGGPLMSTTTRMTSQDPRLKNESDTSCAFQNRRRVP